MRSRQFGNAEKERNESTGLLNSFDGIPFTVFICAHFYVYN